MSIAEKWHRFAALPPDIGESLARLPQLLAEEGVLLAYLFGSLAVDRPGNDVDLALLMPEGNPPYRLRDAIVGCLGTERVDIVDLRRASPVLRFEVISTGRVLYAADADRQLEFELQTLRLYKDTAYLRRQQEELLRERLAQWL